MIKRLYYAAIAVAMITLAVTSCKEDDDTSQEEWMLANQQALNAIKSNPEYKEYHSPGNEASIWCKVLKKGEGKKPIYYTDIIDIYSKGWFVSDYEEKSIKKGDIFQHWLFDDGEPYIVQISSTSSYLLQGMKVALQNMVEGDKWEIWIPYQLGTGNTEISLPYYLGLGSSSTVKKIPAYSTLVIELEVVKVY